MKNVFKMSITALMIIILSGCGGSSGGEEPIQEPPIQELPIQEPKVDTPPTIALNGPEDMTIETGYPYTELGAEATDEEDGSLGVTIEGNVDTSTPNTYVVKYSVVDSGGNSAEKFRYVTVSEGDDTNMTIVSLLAVYSQGSADLYGDGITTRIHHLVALSNEINKKSEIALKYELAHIQQYNIDDNGDIGVVLETLTADSNLSALRDEVGADQVLSYKALNNDGYCGMAWVNDHAYKDYGFASVNIDCPDTTTAHELGHNMGLSHARIQGGTPPLKNYAYGWGIDSEFVTIMSHGDYFSSTVWPKEALVYSNPDLDCYGYACGVEIGLPDEAYAAQAIRELMDTVAGFSEL